MVESNTFHKWEIDEAAVAAIPHFARAHGVEEEEEEVAGFFGRPSFLPSFRSRLRDPDRNGLPRLAASPPPPPRCNDDNDDNDDDGDGTWKTNDAT